MVLEYDGSRYSGWQTQRDRPTVQETLEDAIHRITGEKVTLYGSGRTDRGAHALGQVAHFHSSTDLPRVRLQSALNAVLPRDIAVVDLGEVSEEFHARYDARSKVYRYRIINRPVRPPLERNRAYWVSEGLDLGKMEIAARHLVGEHDFKAFQKEGGETRSTVRQVIRVDIRREGDEVILEVEATGFLYTMVRNFVGCLIRVGRGDWEPEVIREILESKDRGRSGPNTAPAHGLYLLRVHYD